MDNQHRLIVRGYRKKELLFEEHHTITEADLENFLPRLGLQHAEAMAAGRLGMVEIEFLDSPDPEDRFFRIGVETDGMVMPIALKLGSKAN
jgi:hypothetical protein